MSRIVWIIFNSLYIIKSWKAFVTRLRSLLALIKFPSKIFLDQKDPLKTRNIDFRASCNLLLPGNVQGCHVVIISWYSTTNTSNSLLGFQFFWFTFPRSHEFILALFIFEFLSPASAFHTLNKSGTSLDSLILSGHSLHMEQCYWYLTLKKSNARGWDRRFLSLS